MPRGKPVQKENGEWDKEPANEAKLAEPNPILPQNLSQQLKQWWLAVLRNNPNTPNWDIASTCSVDGRQGLLLVEAKAHDVELKGEEKGKPDSGNADNHERIRQCIEEANRGLWNDTRVDWNLSRDSHYQMSNRFAWAWKLTELGVPTILVYLGFLNAEEMKRGRTQKPFADHAEWEQLVKSRSQPLFPAEVWNQQWIVNGQAFVPLIRSMKIPYDRATPESGV